VLALTALALATNHVRVASAQPTTPVVRFHHAHYVVGDPSAAINQAAGDLEGVRVILQGLGVGVRAGREFLLFDRAMEKDAPPRRRSASQAYPLAIERLRSWGFTAEPQIVSHSRVAGTMGELPIDHLGFVTVDFDATVQRALDAGAVVIARRDDSVVLDGGDGLRIEIVRDTDRAETFWCPMHPDVRSADDGKCPLCGMALVPIPSPRIGEYRLDVTQLRERGGAIIGLQLAVREPDTNQLTTRFALVHERRLHLFIVSTDLQYFAHVHPDLQPDATFTLRHTLPPGEYMLIGDFLPEGGTSQMIQRAIIVSGPRVSAPPRHEASGLDVSMRVDGALLPGREARLTFTVKDAKTGAPVSDLEPYLGAPAHMLVVRSDLSDAIHAHPVEQVATGPSVSFHPVIPAPGGYKLWIQFQRNGQVSTSAFELDVPR
jgi:hypothetical protein